MPLPISGPISLDQIQAEFGGPTPIALSQYYRGGSNVPVSATTVGIPTSGTISIGNFLGTSKTLDLEVLVVAGGGGATLGGGGAGGYQAFTTTVSPGENIIVVGAGGAGMANGGDSFGFGITSTGGGGGGGQAGDDAAFPGLSGGSGGGGGLGKRANASGGAGIPGQGNNGADSQYTGIFWSHWSGAGGGANSAGVFTGPGGDGKQWVDGNYYAGGGGAGYSIGGPFTNGGLGGGGSGNTSLNGTVNTGGGGGGSNYSVSSYNFGGSGLVALRYLGTTQRATGGTVIISGGYVYHYFPSSGSFIY